MCSSTAPRIPAMLEYNHGVDFRSSARTGRADQQRLSGATGRCGTRWADNDMFGHLNNAVYYQLFDTAINAWINTSTGLDPITTPALGVVAESGCRYFSELQFPEPRGRAGRHAAGPQQRHLPARGVPGRRTSPPKTTRNRSPRWGTGCTSTSTGSPASRSRSPTPSARCWRRPP